MDLSKEEGEGREGRWGEQSRLLKGFRKVTDNLHQRQEPSWRRRGQDECLDRQNEVDGSQENREREGAGERGRAP
jgi:hypothetical protein